MLFHNEDITELIAEIPGRHRHLIIKMILDDENQVLFHNAQNSIVLKVKDLRKVRTAMQNSIL